MQNNRMDEQLENEQRETALVLVDSIANKMVTKKTFWTGIFALAFILSASWGGVYVYFFEPGFVGLVPKHRGALSYQELMLENEKLKKQIEWQTGSVAAR